MCCWELSVAVSAVSHCNYCSGASWKLWIWESQEIGKVRQRERGGMSSQGDRLVWIWAACCMLGSIPAMIWSRPFSPPRPQSRLQPRMLGMKVTRTEAACSCDSCRHYKLSPSLGSWSCGSFCWIRIPRMEWGKEAKELIDAKTDKKITYGRSNFAVSCLHQFMWQS